MYSLSERLNSRRKFIESNNFTRASVAESWKRNHCIRIPDVSNPRTHNIIIAESRTDLKQ